MIKNIQNVVLIGTGKVAFHLSTAFKHAGIRIVQVYGRQIEKAEGIANISGASAISNFKDLKKDADVYLLAVSDQAIPELANLLPGSRGIVVHTSGFVRDDVFKPLFENYGVFYPLQTFTYCRSLNYKNIPFFIEGSNAKTEISLSKLAKTISSNVTVASSDLRSKIHLAAVFACNFPNFMYSIAQEIMQEAGLPFHLLHPLILETASKATHLMPEAGQTGPAVRNDRKTIEAHLNLIRQLGLQHEEVYALITDKIIEKYKNSDTI